MKFEMCQFSESGAPSLGSQHGMKFAYSALEGALPAIVDEVAECDFVSEAFMPLDLELGWVLSKCLKIPCDQF